MNFTHSISRRSVCLLTCLVSTFCCLLGQSTAGGKVRHVIVYHDVEEFAGWPANGGLWMWGDELLVGFDRWEYDATPTARHHIKDRIGAYYSRSHDGGLTWKGESKLANVKSTTNYDFEDMIMEQS